jgi:hypothetical protein
MSQTERLPVNQCAMLFEYEGSCEYHAIDNRTCDAFDCHTAPSFAWDKPD